MAYQQPPPARRHLHIFAYDPLLGRQRQTRISIDVPYEKLSRGPAGRRVQVIDYDATHDRYYEGVELDDVNIALQGGLEPSEADPRFHQQMAYAVASRVIENFDLALGRWISLSHKGQPLRIFPHAFEDANAYYDDKMHALLFGYFRVDAENPGGLLPGQTVFTCLSHDIVAHETTHALVNRLRPYFMEQTNSDVGAFHEAFADIVAIFQRFTFADLVRDAIQETRGDLRQQNPFVNLAAEFGHGTGMGNALRTAIDQPDPARFEQTEEPHERGAIVVAAIFDAFHRTFVRRGADLIRIATGGSGVLPPGALAPDLVNRLAQEAARTAQTTLTMCIRAFEYLPPVDVTFGDFLRALVTADADLSPVDEVGLRGDIIESFRQRGIYPDGVRSLSEESVRFEDFSEAPNPDDWRLPLDEPAILRFLQQSIAGYSRTSRSVSRLDEEGVNPSEKSSVPGDPDEYVDDEYGSDLRREIGHSLWQWANKSRDRLGLRPDLKIAVRGFHPSVRSTRQGYAGDFVVQLVQTQRDADHGAFGGLPLRGGITVVTGQDGYIRYLIRKSIPNQAGNDSERARFARQTAFVASCDRSDPYLPWADAAYQGQRMKLRMGFKRLHGG